MISVLLLTRSNSGQQLLDTVTKRLGTLPLDCHTLTFNPEAQSHIVFPHIQGRIKRIDKGDGVLILMDCVTDHQELVDQLLATSQIACVSGLNDPMIAALYQCEHLSLIDASEAVAKHARSNIQTFIRSAAD
ncbi:hypothetical protein [Pleionea sp. CnH1-48]|uniref:PTS sugar transporter subunit IIA domain-containing protein n=1 Tax=Pleionea sp. CnH1-48 TaxID=2954494 RepID=UPI002097FE86|nr:hypothetical protein [Pleionea sp. CnH1-48]MCO7224037.1 hypothetical protein [Pleionea sp. CnH1-48]